MRKTVVSLLAVVMSLGLYQAASAQDQPTAAALYNQGLEKLKAEDFKTALSLLDQAIQKADTVADAEIIKLSKRNGAVAAYKLGSAYRKEKKADDALAAFNKGIGYAPEFYQNYIGRAQALEDKGKNLDALNAYLEAGEMSEKSKNAEKAVQMYQKAENFAAVAFGQKKWDETIACSEAYLAKRESADAHFYLAHALKAKGKADQAVEQAKKALELAQGEKSKIYMILAESLEALGQKDKALENYKLVTEAKYLERAQYKIKELSGSR